MKSGFTTGSCAAAAAKAATIMLFENEGIGSVSVATPSGAVFDTPVTDVMLTKGIRARCAVRKPESDDPDVTAGMLIYATAEFAPFFRGNGSYPASEAQVVIEGGEGIGRVTKPGLDRPVGDFAINTVPRQMIEDEVLSVAEEYGYTGTIRIEISAPEGEMIAKKTFNPRLGIEGGISIIGTSGVVEPMSTRAIIDTIRVELAQKKALGEKIAVVSPGNYGFTFMKEHYDYDLDRAVKCSNYIGDTIDIARDTGFEKMLLVGHIGKLIKVSGGVMNTHSKEGDGRMELMAEAAGHAGADEGVLKGILGSVSTEEAYRIMRDANIEDKSFAYIMDRIDRHLKARAGRMSIECIVYSSVYGLLGRTNGAEEMMKEAMKIYTNEVDIK